MISTLLLSVALLGADEPPAAAKVADTPALELYREATANAGKNADAHVRLALWCEAHGLTAERLKHLSLAVLCEPTNALARGLMGLVDYRGRWVPPDKAAEQIQDDPVPPCGGEGVPRPPGTCGRNGRRPDEAGGVV